MRTSVTWLVVIAGSCTRIATAQPDVPGFSVEVYAELCEPVRISLGEAGILYAGNGGCAGSNGGPAWVRRIGVGGSPIENHGASQINDPDSVLLDPIGFGSSEPGSILVGGPGVRAILPDESIITVLGSNGLIGNVADMRFDSNGRLLVFNLNPGRVAVSASGEPVTELFTLPATAMSLIVDTNDRIITTAQDGVIRIHNADGTVVDSQFVVGLGAKTHLAFGPGGPWGSDLYAISEGTLLRIDIDGNVSVVGTGFSIDIDDLEFGPDGALYTSSDTGNQILRIVFVCVGDVDGTGDVSVSDLLLLLAQWGPCPPKCFGDINGDGAVNVPDLLMLLAAWGACP